MVFWTRPLRALEVDHRACAIAVVAHERPPELARGIRGEDLEAREVAVRRVAVAHPDTDRERRLALALVGFGRKPYVDTSLTQLVVPVLRAMMRRCPPGPFRSWKFLPQYGFWRGSELPARMFAMIQAAWGLQTLRLTGAPGVYTDLPLASSTLRMNRGSVTRPSFPRRHMRRSARAGAPRACRWPRVSPAWPIILRPLRKVMPALLVYWSRALLPSLLYARMAGMLSDCWSA